MYNMMSLDNFNSVIDFDRLVLNQMADKGQNTQSERTNIPKKVHLLWTPAKDDVLFDALLDEQAKGNRIGDSWTSK